MALFAFTLPVCYHKRRLFSNNNMKPEKGSHVSVVLLYATGNMHWTSFFRRADSINTAWTPFIVYVGLLALLF